MPNKLTTKQRRFVEEYLVDGNASQAAVRAGYSERTARQQGYRLLTKVYIAVAIAAAQEERSKRTEVTADRVVEELARIAFADIRNLFVWDEEQAAYVPSQDLSDDAAAGVSSVKAKTTHYNGKNGDGDRTEILVELKTYDKLKALELLAKHLGLFQENPIYVAMLQLVQQLPPGELEQIATDRGRLVELLEGSGFTVEDE